MTGARAGVVLPLSGRYGPMAAQAAAGLSAWADRAGVPLEIEDSGEDPDEAARRMLGLAASCELLFGPYGSGAMRAVARAFATRPEVIWNHGGAAAPRTGARVVDVLGPADRYWSGLGDVLRDAGTPLDRVAVLMAGTGFGRSVAAGAVASLAAAGHGPCRVQEFDASTAGRAASAALAAGASAVVGCGRMEDDLELGRALSGSGATVGLVAGGVAAAGDALGDAVVGLLGPCQWLPDESPPPVPLHDADYPAGQALAAGIIAEEVLERAGSSDPDAVWDAARSHRTSTFMGPFALDADGRQTAHRPMIVRWIAAADGPRRVCVWRPPA